MTAQRPIIERSARIAGFRTRTLSLEGEGPAILLLHGFTDSADTWRPVLRMLAGRSRRTIAVDLPGHGWADPVRPGSVLAQLHEFTAVFVGSNADSGPVVLAGNSLGGLLALRAAQREDLALLAVAGVAPAGLGYGRRLERLAALSRGPLAPAVRASLRLPVPRMVVQGGSRALYELRLSEGRADPELGRLYASHVARMRDVRRFAGYFRQIDADVLAEPPVTLEEIRYPVQLIWGRRDPLVTLDGAQRLLRIVADSRLVVFEDCGHCPQVQRPVDVARLLAALPESIVGFAGAGAAIVEPTVDVVSAGPPAGRAERV